MKQLIPISPAQLQLDSYNKSGGAGDKETFTLAAEDAWAVVGTLVHDSVTVGDVPTLKSAIQALPQVIVPVPLHWGQAPAEILVNAEPKEAPTETHETVLAVSAKVVQTISFGGGRGQTSGATLCPAAPIKPPLGRKFIVWGFKVPASLDQAGIATLEAAVARAHAGITSAHHLLDGVIDAECVGDATIEISARTRIDAIPVELAPEPPPE